MAAAAVTAIADYIGPMLVQYGASKLYDKAVEWFRGHDLSNSLDSLKKGAIDFARHAQIKLKRAGRTIQSGFESQTPFVQNYTTYRSPLHTEELQKMPYPVSDPTYVYGQQPMVNPPMYTGKRKVQIAEPVVVPKLSAGGKRPNVSEFGYTTGDRAVEQQTPGVTLSQRIAAKLAAPYAHNAPYGSVYRETIKSVPWDRNIAEFPPGTFSVLDKNRPSHFAQSGSGLRLEKRPAVPIIPRRPQQEDLISFQRIPREQFGFTTGDRKVEPQAPLFTRKPQKILPRLEEEERARALRDLKADAEAKKDKVEKRKQSIANTERLKADIDAKKARIEKLKQSIANTKILEADVEAKRARVERRKQSMQKK